MTALAKAAPPCAPDRGGKGHVWAGWRTVSTRPLFEQTCRFCNSVRVMSGNYLIRGYRTEDKT